MGALRSLIVAAALVAATPAHADAVDRWRAEIAEASLRFGIPMRWIARVMRAESGGQTHADGRPIRSRAGAMGLMQLMPRTWAAMTRAHGLGADPDAPRANILAGTAYLRAMYDRFGYPGLFAAYNAGPARYSAYLEGRARLPAETIAYVATIGGRAVRAETERPLQAAPSRVQPILFALSRKGEAAVVSGEKQPGDPLFAVRHDVD
jgi:soluble lytic murein transglycosylase-like protein